MVLLRERPGVRDPEAISFGQKYPLADPPIFAHACHFELTQSVHLRIPTARPVHSLNSKKVSSSPAVNIFTSRGMKGTEMALHVRNQRTLLAP